MASRCWDRAHYVDMGRVLSLAVAAALALTLTACGGSDPGGGGSAPSASPHKVTSSATASPEEPVDAPKLVDIGGGRHVSVRCIGTGSPTIVLESGDESDQFQWSEVFRQVAAETRVCAYDRLGNGSSDPAIRLPANVRAAR
jgi:pimeloyl-ACP methyl ester carboxylesterase